MNHVLTSLEVLGLAIRSEEDAAKFYGHTARLIANPMVAERYKALAREEVQHAQMLQGLYKRLSGGQEKAPEIPGQPVVAEGGAVPKEQGQSLEDLLKLAVEREHEAYVFYTRAAQQSADDTGKKILYYLANVESGHELMLRKELELYLADKDWYAGDGLQDMLHVGP